MKRARSTALLAAAVAAGPAAGQLVHQQPYSTDFHDPAHSLENLHPAEGYEVSLFASEQDFPIGNPVALTFDARGRLWVATMPSYPQRLPNVEPDDKIVILEDSDGNGSADRHTVFADGLNQPTGFELGDGGAYVAQIPNLLFLEDTDGDGVADRREVILQGFGTEDSHHAISSFTWGPGGGLYFQEGLFHHTQVETPHGVVRLVNGGVFRYEPRQFRLEVFAAYPFVNPWGHVFDRWGQNFVSDGSPGRNYFAAPAASKVTYPRRLGSMNDFTVRVRPLTGSEIVSSSHFPDSVQGNFLVCEVFTGMIRQYRLSDSGSGFAADEADQLLYSSLRSFRPIAVQFGPDGALYVVDWSNWAINHPDKSMRDYRRDSDHGRIWRVKHATRSLVAPPDVAGASTPALVRLLETYEDRTRYRVRRELRERPQADVLAALQVWLQELDTRELEEGGEADVAAYEHHRLEALWAYQNLNVVNTTLLTRMLGSTEPRARAAATRVARFWRRDLDNLLALLTERVEDSFARTRLEALVGLSFLDSEDAAEAALRARDHPTDHYIDYVLGNTVDSLENAWLTGLERDPSLLDSLSTAQGRYLLGRLATGKLERLPAHALIDRALLHRADGDFERQRRALERLSATARETPAMLLAGELQRLDQVRPVEPGRLDRLVEHLFEQDAESLRAAAGVLESLSRTAAGKDVRSAAIAVLIVAGGSPSPGGVLPPHADAERLIDWLRAVDRLPPPLAAEAFPAVSALLDDPGSQDRRVLDAAALTLAGMTQTARRGFRRLAALASDPATRTTALEALGELTANAPDAWPEVGDEEALGSAVLAAIRAAPARDLTSSRYRRIHDLGRRIADRLIGRSAGERGKELRDELVNLAPAIVAIRAVPHETRFDMDEFTVPAGRPVEITFRNDDVKSHNFVLVRPGKLEEVGLATEAEAERDPIGMEKAGYVPRQTHLVVAHTGLVEAGEEGVLRFDAPRAPGRYEFACMVPGHWTSMSGTMSVVERPPRASRPQRKSSPS